jgi:hypothetical protein
MRCDAAAHSDQQKQFLEVRPPDQTGLASSAHACTLNQFISSLYKLVENSVALYVCRWH